MASVRIEDEAFVDARIELLGKLAGYNRFEALGRMAHLWRVCTQRDTYVLDPIWIAACLGDKGPDALVQAGLGEQLDGGAIRIKGTEGRIEWLRIRRAAGAAGGRSSSTKRQAKDNQSQAGPNDRPTDGKQTGSKPVANDQQTPTVVVANTNPPTPTPVIGEIQKTPLPPAKPGGEADAPETPPPAPLPLALDTPEFAHAWANWKAERRAKRIRPYTVKGEEQQLAKLAKAGVEIAIRAIEESIAQGWQGIFPDRVKSKSSGNAKLDYEKKTALDAMGLPSD